MNYEYFKFFPDCANAFFKGLVSFELEHNRSIEICMSLDQRRVFSAYIGVARLEKPCFRRWLGLLELQRMYNFWPHRRNQLWKVFRAGKDYEDSFENVEPCVIPVYEEKKKKDSLYKCLCMALKKRSPKDFCGVYIRLAPVKKPVQGARTRKLYFSALRNGVKDVTELIHKLGEGALVEGDIAICANQEEDARTLKETLETLGFSVCEEEAYAGEPLEALFSYYTLDEVEACFARLK